MPTKNWKPERLRPSFGVRNTTLLTEGILNQSENLVANHGTISANHITISANHGTISANHITISANHDTISANHDTISGLFNSPNIRLSYMPTNHATDFSD